MDGAPSPVPTGPLPVPDVRQLSINFFGPRLVSLFLQGLESGILINQSIRFWTHAGSGKEKERWLVKGMVIFVTTVGLFQTCVAMYDCWHIFVLNFSDFPAAMTVTWGMKIQPVVTILMAAPVQAFLMWRCWILSKRSWTLIIFLTVLWFGTIVTAVRVTINVFKVDFAALLAASQAVVPEEEFVIPIDPYFMASLVFPAFLDVCLTSILLIFLLRSRSTVVTRRFRRILARLAVIVWEAALPPSICALLTMITYVTLLNKSSWDLLFQSVLGQLYVISLFVTINGFRYVKSKEMGLSPSTALGRGSWRTGGDVRIQMRPPSTASSMTSPSASYPLHAFDSLQHESHDAYRSPHSRAPQLRGSIIPRHSQFMELQRLDIPAAKGDKDRQRERERELFAAAGVGVVVGGDMDKDDARTSHGEFADVETPTETETPSKEFTGSKMRLVVPSSESPTTPDVQVPPTKRLKGKPS